MNWAHKEVELGQIELIENMLQKWPSIAFKSLDWLRADYADLYDVVRALLSNYTQPSSTQRELQKHKKNEKFDAISSHENLRALDKKAI